MTTSSYHSIKQANIAILGGGLAGLSLAAELSAPEFSHLSVVIIEPRSEYVRDKTWSYWRQKPHDFSDCESAIWRAWRVQHAQSSALASALVNATDAENYVYASIASDTFYKAALAKIKACSHIELLQGERVQSLRAESGAAIIGLKSAQNIVVSDIIFDARPPLKNTKNKQLNQHFLGLELHADQAIFDVSCVDLMDFQATQHGLHFFYVLPYSATHALIESTWICSHQTHADYAQELNNYLLKRWPTIKFDVAYTEAASLPLVAQKAQKSWLGRTQIVPIGSLAGTARAATGYAFLETLQDAKRLANLLKNNQPLTTFKRHKIDAWMDKLFLSFLSKNAQLGAHTFVQLFANCPPASLVRFLTGCANWRDRLAVICAMPAKPMLTHIMMLK